MIFVLIYIYLYSIYFIPLEYLLAWPKGRKQLKTFIYKIIFLARILSIGGTVYRLLNYFTRF